MDTPDFTATGAAYAAACEQAAAAFVQFGAVLSRVAAEQRAALSEKQRETYDTAHAAGWSHVDALAAARMRSTR